MAESDSKGGRKGTGRSGSSRSSSSDSRNQSSPRELVQDAKGQIQELLGRPVEAVLGMEKDDNEWLLTVEVVELVRVPNTTDILGKYEVTLDKDGEVTGARRVRRYPRGAPGED